MKKIFSISIIVISFAIGMNVSASSLDFHNEVAQDKTNGIKMTSFLNFGDMMLDRNVKKQIDANGADYIFKKLAGNNDEFFGNVDAVECNLEGSFANKRRATSKSIAFDFDPKLIAMVKKYHFNLFNLANNHSLDMSREGFKESQANLKKNDIAYYGQQYKVDSTNLLVKKIGDFTFGLIGLDDTINKIQAAQVKKLVDAAKLQGADFVVVNIHWGDEYKPLSNSRQRQLGHTLIDLGVDAIIGHHPHVVEEMEIYKNHPIFFSLGNFVFDQYFSVPTQQELGLGLIFTKANDQKSISIYTFPLQSVRSQISQMNEKDSLKFFNDWTKRSRLGDKAFNNYHLTLDL